MTDWYLRADELESGDVFLDHRGRKVKLLRRVPDDGTQWYVAEWVGNSWGHFDRTIEPGDLVDRAG